MACRRNKSPRRRFDRQQIVLETRRGPAKLTAAQDRKNRANGRDSAMPRRAGFQAGLTWCRHRPTIYYKRLMPLVVAVLRHPAESANGLAWHVGCSLFYKGPQQVESFRRLSLPVEPSNYLFCVIRRTVATPRRCAYFYFLAPTYGNVAPL